MTATPLHLHSRLLDARTPAAWRRQVRHVLLEVRELLSLDSPAPHDAWLAARVAGVHRERSALLDRLAQIGPRVLRETPAEVRADLRRLLVDVDHHLQRRRDLAWDEVELELGGSE